MKRVFFII